MPVMGLPGCVMYAGATIFDLMLPYVAADVPVTRADVAALGEGGCASAARSVISRSVRSGSSSFLLFGIGGCIGVSVLRRVIFPAWEK